MIRTPRCPGCDHEPAMKLSGDRQWFCGRDDCSVIAWDPTKTLQQLMADVSRVDLDGLTSPGDDESER